MVTVETYAYVTVFVFATLLLAKLGSRFANRLIQKLVLRGKLPSHLEGFSRSLIRSVIWVVAAFLLVAEISAAFGFRGFITNSILLFLSANGGRIGVMLVTVIGAYVTLRIFGLVFSEYKQHTKLHPMTLDLFHSVVRYLIYAVASVMLLTNFLVMAGLQSIAGTMITLFTVFIGLVVSFAATGSIGNALSGLVVMSWRPFKEGDRVELAGGGGIIGDVIEVDVMFTQIRTSKNEVVHVPNSQVLASKIVNFSKMPKVIVHQEIPISYEVQHSCVEQLLLEAANGSKNLLSEPKPFVLIKNLDNNYVTYEINAYTDKVNELNATHSGLIQRILDKFDESGIDISSSQQIVVRGSSPSNVSRA